MILTAPLLILVCLLSTMAMAKPIKILALGDSLTAGSGLPQPDGFVPNLEKALQDQGLDVTVINAGVSGDTSAGGLARLDWSLADNPDLAIVTLGANDGMRGLAPAATKQNLVGIIEGLQAKGVAVFLAGMLAPPNMGSEYASEFNPIYQELADTYSVPLYPFFLEGVVADQSLNQEDRIHPNAEGVDVIVSRIIPPLVKTLKTLK